MSIIDRLENDGLIVREADPSNRRIRIPRTTDHGQQILKRTLIDRDRAVEQTLASFQDGDLPVLRTLLWQIATAE